jgi:uncharacterized protein YutE (UPF0331/DUF86 family)
MGERINDKIKEIEDYLGELEEIIPSNFEIYKKDFKIRAACERYFEKIIEAVIDLAIFTIKKKNLANPESDESVFKILHEVDIISEELAKRLINAKGMRNVIAHKYGEVNDELVFFSITEELIKDVNDFIGSLGD